MQRTAEWALNRIAPGVMIISFAMAILVAWLTGEWWTFVAVLLLAVGGFHTAQGLLGSRGESQSGRGPSRYSYFLFWGPTLLILGAIVILASVTDVSSVVLLIILLVWIGAIAMILSLRRKNTAPGP